MTYKGHVENGLIVPDEPIEMADGTRVSFEIALRSDSEGDQRDGSGNMPSLTNVLSRFAGRAHNLPEDAAENLDHYLYGVPKK
ncbi:MAG: hypothetical protein GY851_14185 [bacterium]|nr:hypothetical protein [bacterium]